MNSTVMADTDILIDSLDKVLLAFLSSSPRINSLTSCPLGLVPVFFFKSSQL